VSKKRAKNMKNWAAARRKSRRIDAARAAETRDARQESTGPSRSPAPGPIGVDLTGATGAVFEEGGIEGFGTGVLISDGDMATRDFTVRHNQRAIDAKRSKIDLTDSEIE
jgi:hypothetical protein